MKWAPVLWVSGIGFPPTLVLILGWLAAPSLAASLTEAGNAVGAFDLFKQTLLISIQVLGTFVAILVVYVVFKLSNVFVRLEEAGTENWTETEDIRMSRQKVHDFQRLLDLKRRYVRPLAMPVVAMSILLGMHLMALPFIHAVALLPVASIRGTVISAASTTAAVLWTTRVAFGSAIEE